MLFCKNSDLIWILSMSIRSRKLTKRQIICQLAYYLSILQTRPFVKGQMNALKNIFFMKLSGNIEVPVFGA